MAPVDDASRGAAPAFPLLPPGLASSVLAQLYPPPHPYADDPVGWMRDVARESPWSKQREIAESVRDHRYTAVKACHGAGKSFIASRIAAWWVSVYGKAAFVVWTAPRNDQVHGIIGEELRSLPDGVRPGEVNLSGTWYLDGKLVGQGRKPADHDAHGFQGIHRPKVLVIIDEACGIPETLWTAVDSIVTNEDCRVLAIGNPDDPTSEFAKKCKPGSGWHVLTIDALRTPQFTDEGRELPDDVVRQLTSRVWVEERRKRWGERSPQWISKVRGEFPEVDDRSVFPPNLVLKACNTELPGIERGVAGFDIARFGPDRTVGYRNRGGHSRRVLRHTKLDTEETADRIEEYLAGTPALPAVIDVGGIGGGVFDKLKRRKVNVVAFDGSTRARNPKRFKNRRAEAYWAVRTLMEDGLVDVDPEDEQLLDQLSTIRFREDSARRIVIESKDELVKRLGKGDEGKSPDELDAFVYSFVEVADVPREAVEETREELRRVASAQRAALAEHSDAEVPIAGEPLLGDISDVPL